MYGVKGEIKSFESIDHGRLSIDDEQGAQIQPSYKRSASWQWTIDHGLSINYRSESTAR
jgi:hypothetical protein